MSQGLSDFTKTIFPPTVLAPSDHQIFRDGFIEAGSCCRRLVDSVLAQSRKRADLDEGTVGGCGSDTGQPLIDSGGVLRPGNTYSSKSQACSLQLYASS